MKTEREAFESAMVDYWKDDPRAFERWPDGGYVWKEVASAFVAWQIASHLARDAA
jgi:hypothetical protein